MVNFLNLKRSLVKPGAVLVLLLSALSGATAHAWTQAFEEWADQLGMDLSVSYQATRVMHSKEGSFQFGERRAPGKMLMDMEMQGMQASMLLREDLQKSYMLMPSMGMYREMPMAQAQQQQGGVEVLEEVTKVGSETINGYPATKFKTRFRSKDGSGEGFVWITDDGVPIKMDMLYSSRRNKGQHLVMELKDLKVGPQDAAHFELPANLKPMNLGGLGRMLQQQ